MKSQQRFYQWKTNNRSGLLVLMTFLLFMLHSQLIAAPLADLNVLIIGSTADSGDRLGGTSAAFAPTEIATELDSILSGAGLGTVNVHVEERYDSKVATASVLARQTYCYNLASWFHWPYPAGAESNRWANLRGEAGTQWDYVILIGDPFTMEYMPGVYAHGVGKIGEEVAKGQNGTAETILLMPWPATGSNSSVAHYKEAVYRAGRTGGYKVAPAALAWEADGSNTGTTHPSTRGAYICAASIYSRIWNQSASNSTYTYTNNGALADAVHTTVTNNVGAPQFSGSKMNFQNAFLMLGDKRRDVHYSEKGSSTEQGYKTGAADAITRARVNYNYASYSDKYSSNTPEDDNRGWPTGNAMPIAWNHGRRSYDSRGWVVNPDYWQFGFGLTYQCYFANNDDYLAATIEDLNDYTVSMMYADDAVNAVENDHNLTFRSISARTLWAGMHQGFPSLNPNHDRQHMNLHGNTTGGAYMYTLYSGRCPVDPKPNPVTSTWWAQKVGYETAWRLGTGSSRAPGFKVMPSSASALTVTPTTTETMTVQFIFPPRHDVTVQISSSDPSAAIVGPRTLVFTPSNYNVPQSITIAGVEGTTASAPFTIDFATTSDDAAYNELTDSWAYTTTRTANSVTHVDNGTTPYSTPKNFAATLNLSAPGATAANTTFAGPNHGSLSWNGPDVVYTPATDYVGPDGFAYWSINAGTVTTGYIDIDVIDGFPAGSVRAEATDAEATEAGQTTGTWSIIREGSTAGDLQVYFSIGGTAVPSDYVIDSSSPITIPNGQSSVTVTLTPVDDSAREYPETVTLTTTTDAAYTAITNPAAITITDDDNTAPTAYAGVDKTVTLDSSALWTPAQASPVAWYDVSDTGTITLNGSTVSEWADKSGNANHATQETAGAQPTYDSANNKLVFDGNDIMKVANDPFKGLQNFAVVTVQKWNTDSGWNNASVAYHGESGNGWQVRQHSNGTFCFTVRATAGGDDPTSTSTNNLEFLGSCIRKNASDRVIRQNGTDTYSTTGDTGTIAYNGTNRSSIGGRYQGDSWSSPGGYLKGELKEVIVIENPTDEDVQTTEGYLAWKWGLEGDLPVGHNHKNGAPGAPAVSVLLSDATVTDPNVGETLTGTWTVISTPPGGTAIFDNANLINATVTLDTVGEYILRLTGSDGTDTDPDDVVITVDPAVSDTTPPNPDPMTWSSVPTAVNSSSITMTATTASDSSGVEYYFTETSGNSGGADSGWQDSPTYTNTGLQANTQYTYTVTARDKAATPNTTAASDPASATTPEFSSTVDAGNSTVVATPNSVPADGSTTSTVTVTLKDSAGSPVSGKTVSLAGDGSATIQTSNTISDASGVVVFTVSSTTVGTETFTATGDGVAITQAATVDFQTVSTGGSVLLAGFDGKQTQNTIAPASIYSNSGVRELAGALQDTGAVGSVTARIWTDQSTDKELQWGATNQSTTTGDWGLTNFTTDASTLSDSWVITQVGASWINIEVTNSGSQEITLETFHISAKRTGTDAATTLTVSLEDNGTFANPPVLSPSDLAASGSQAITLNGDTAWGHYEFALSSMLSDSTLAAGETATLRIANNAGTARLYLDNIAVSGTIGGAPPATTYTLIYTAGAGGTISGTTPQTVDEGVDGTAVTAVPDTGYSFVDWSDAVTTATRTDTNVTADITVTANFAITTYTVTFVEGANGTRTGGGDLVQTVDHGNGAVEPTITADAGWTFTGWDVAFDTVTSNLTVTAQYTAVPTYTLTVNNGTGDGSYAEGAVVNIAATIPANYHFVNWTGDTGAVANVNSATSTVTMPAAAVTVTANTAIDTYTVTFVEGANGIRTGGGALVQTVDHGSAAVEPTVTADAGWTFTGWDVAFDTVTSDLTTTAQYSAVTNGTVTLSVDSAAIAENGGIATFTATLSEISALDVIVELGFAGSASADVDYLASDSQIIIYAGSTTGSIAVDAIDDSSVETDETVVVSIVNVINAIEDGQQEKQTQITDDDILATYTVTYLGNGNTGGIVPDIQTKTAGADLALATNSGSLVKSGFTFSGWNTAIDGGGTMYAEGATYSVDADLTLYAKWSSVPVYTLAVNNGTGDGSYAEGAVVAITATVPANYHFVNWTGDTGAVANVNSATTTVTMPAAAVTVTANTAIDTYIVTFVEGANGSRTGGGALVQTVDHGSAAVAPTITADAGWTFTGWDVAFDTVTSGLTVTAQYVADTTNRAPVAYNQSLSVKWSQDIAITLTASDADNDPLEYTVVSGPSGGTLTGTAPNLSYKSNGGFKGLDSFTFKANDGKEDSNVATVTIDVTNRKPQGSANTVSTTQDTATAFSLDGSDDDGDALEFTVTSSPANGTLSGTAPDVTYTPAAGYIGNDSLVYVISDGLESSDPVTVGLTVTADNKTGGGGGGGGCQMGVATGGSLLPLLLLLIAVGLTRRRARQ